MLNILVDGYAIGLLLPTGQRGIYFSRAPWRAWVELPSGLNLLDLEGQVFEGENKPEVGQPLFSRTGQAGELHMHITLHRRTAEFGEIRLSDMLTNSYRDDEIG